jgi:hypothetical protein
VERKRRNPAVRDALLGKTRHSRRQVTAGEALQPASEEEAEETLQLKKEDKVETQEILVPQISEPLTYETLRDRHWARVTLPSQLWAFHKEPSGKFIAFTHISENTSSTYVSTDKAVVFDGTLEAEIYVRGKKATPQNFLQSAPVTLEQLDGMLHDVESLSLCKGTGLDADRYSPDCCLFLERKYRNSRCSNCALKRTHLKKTEAQRLRRAAAKQKEPLKRQIPSKRQTRIKKDLEVSEGKSSVEVSNFEDFLEKHESHLEGENEERVQNNADTAEYA